MRPEAGMDDTLEGTRDRRGYWRPTKRVKRAPVFVWPVQPRAFLRWFAGYPGYLWPWNTIFFTTHRLIHMGPLYSIVHKVHHHNVNPGPWSGLSMHTFEHLIYFSAVLFVFVVPSHPLHAMFLLTYLATGPAAGHVGFHRMVT